MWQEYPTSYKINNMSIELYDVKGNYYLINFYARYNSSDAPFLLEIISKSTPVTKHPVISGTDVGIITRRALVEHVCFWLGSARHILIAGVTIKDRYFAERPYIKIRLTRKVMSGSKAQKTLIKNFLVVQGAVC